MTNTAITETPAHLTTRAALDTLVTAGRIRTYGLTAAGRYFIRPRRHGARHRRRAAG